MIFKFENLKSLMPAIREVEILGQTFLCRELSADDYKAYAALSIKASQSKSSKEMENVLKDMTAVVLKGGMVDEDYNPIFKNDKQVREFTSTVGAALVKTIEDTITSEVVEQDEKKSSGEQSSTEGNSTSN